MEYVFKNNWREKVAAMTEADDLDIEKTFSDIASGFVANKVGDLMKDPHRIGFEIVKKNEDNTKMLGIFAFKVDKELIFAPVFFLHGEVKGPLLYRCDTKQFLPATKDWASYLIESIETKEGRGVDKTKLGDTSPMVSLDKIMMRPKSASQHQIDQDILQKAIALVKENGGMDLPAEKFDELVNQTYDKLISENINIKQAFVEEFGDNFEQVLQDTLSKSAFFTPGILKEFLSEEGYGMLTLNAIEKAASSDNSGKLLEHLFALYGEPSNLLDGVTIKDFAKEASEPRTLEAHFEFTKEAAENPVQYFKDGFFMFDKRYKDDCCRVTKNPVHSSITSVVDAGIYDLVKEDGTLEKDIFCAHIIPACGSVANKGNWYTPSPLSKLDYILAVDKSGKTSVYNNVLGINKLNSTIETIVNTDKQLPGQANIEKGGVYVAYIPGKDSSTAPFYVIDKYTTDGVGFCKVKFLPAYKLQEDSGDVSDTPIWWDNGNYHKVIHNKDASSNFDKGVFGSDVKFIKLDATVTKDKYGVSSDCADIKLNRIQNIADGSQANEWVFDKFDAPTIQVNCDKEASIAPYTIYDTVNDETSFGMNKFQIMTKLASNLKIHATDAYDIISTAEDTGSCLFMLEGIDKLASQIRIVGRPRFTEEFDQATGLPISEKQTFILDTAGIQEFDTRPHVGDALNPTTATGLPNLTVVSTAPDQLRELADTYNLPNVFEHGAVGVLADTFDANQLITKYINKLQEAVDSLGRMKFLMYQKPEDFQRAYGSDDMINLEAEINTNFEALGDITLKLLKKSDKSKKSPETIDNSLD